MILTFKQVISPQELNTMHKLVQRGKFVDGKETAGSKLADGKRNQQLSGSSEELQQIAKTLILA